MKLLALREHSRQELLLKLLQRDYPRADIVLVLADLAQNNLQSDARFTEAYVYSRSSKGYGPERISMELQQKGISDSLIHDFLYDDEKWREIADRVYVKKFGRSAPKDLREKIKRQQFMRYRGFAYYCS